jgi:beta-D-xylosidase 4
MVEGLEGDKEEKRIIATPKHFAANDLDKWNGLSRHTFNAEIDLQDLAEYYLFPFQGCMRDLKAGSIMTSYNAVNGVPASANTYLLQTVLRDHWKWTGAQNFIVSDCGAVADVAQSHKYRETNAEGFYECVKSGLDLACESKRYNGVVESWEAGLLTEDMVDGALRRVYEGLIQTGYFSGAESEWAHLGWGDVNTEEAQSLALKAAVDGIILLKNDGTLPLGREEGSSSTLAMVGFWADKGEHLHGDYSGKAPFSHTPVWAAEKMGFTVHATGGPTLEGDDADDHWTEAAVEAAEKSDYIIYFGGLSTEAAAEGRDRMAIEWPRAQLALLRKLAKLGKPLVVVQLGDQVDNTPLLEDDSGISAILWTSWPGQDGGTAVLRILTGEDAPAGRLPVTQYPAKYADEIPMSSMKLRPTSDHPGRTYRWYQDAVQPFGFGLHYTDFEVLFGSFPSTFSIQELVNACSSYEFPDTCAFTPLKVYVENTGSRKSDYSALAFVKGEFGPEPYPLKTLAAYSRLRSIGPGESKSAELSWTLGDLARHDEDGNTVLYPGEYVVLLDEPARAELKFTLLGEPAVLDKWPALPATEDVHDRPDAEQYPANQEL